MCMNLCVEVCVSDRFENLKRKTEHDFDKQLIFAHVQNTHPCNIADHVYESMCTRVCQIDVRIYKEKQSILRNTNPFKHKTHTHI